MLQTGLTRTFQRCALSLAALSLGSFAMAQGDPESIVNAIENSGGRFEGFRRSGAKGICASGVFMGSSAARRLSVASAFSGAPISVVIRFSIGGANPKAPDNAKTQRNMALQLNLPRGELWQMGNISAPIFGAATPEQFIGRLESLAIDPTTGEPDPRKVEAFSQANPEVLLQRQYFASQPVPASFATVNYWGVHSFAFIDIKGIRHFGKWIFRPVSGLVGLTDDEAEAKGSDFLANELRQRVAVGPIEFDFVLQLAEAGDRLDSAVVPLPDDRKKVTFGRLKITAVAPDTVGHCLTINFNPNVLPKGIEPSRDPLLAARTKPYDVSLKRRVSEGAKQ
jgi:catalase